MADPFTIAAIAAVGSAATSVIGGAVQAQGYNQAADAAEEDAEFEAQQLERSGKEEFAASQREAFAARRESRLAQSRAQAVAAASGGGAGADAPTIVQIMGGLARQGELNAQSALYVGESRRAGARDQAFATRRTGRSQAAGYRNNAFASILSGIGGGFSSLSGFG